MKKLLGLFLLSVVSLFAQAEKLDFGARGKLTIYLTDNWSIETSDFGDRKMIKVTPKDSKVNAHMEITVTFPETDRFDTKARLKMRVEVDATKFSEQSVEGKARAQEFSLGTGYGYYCTFTDPDLVGKPPQPGNFKNVSVGLIRLAPDVILEVGINADGVNSEPYQQLLGAIEGMEFKAGAGR
ncbi:MAG: hypothetical protein NTV51_32265 [Verrucomicrobia bacterium]|nr:hypothetical protein [Verrucomicrobiota bacterium]